MLAHFGHPEGFVHAGTGTHAVAIVRGLGKQIDTLYLVGCTHAIIYQSTCGQIASIPAIPFGVKVLKEVDVEPIHIGTAAVFHHLVRKVAEERSIVLGESIVGQTTHQHRGTWICGLDCLIGYHQHLSVLIGVVSPARPTSFGSLGPIIVRLIEQFPMPGKVGRTLVVVHQIGQKTGELVHAVRIDGRARYCSGPLGRICHSDKQAHAGLGDQAQLGVIVRTPDIVWRLTRHRLVGLDVFPLDADTSPTGPTIPQGCGQCDVGALKQGQPLGLGLRSHRGAILQPYRPGTHLVQSCDLKPKTRWPVLVYNGQQG